jgi:hypothetical protein
MDSQEFSGCANEQPKSWKHSPQYPSGRDSNSSFCETVATPLSDTTSAERNSDIQNARSHSRQANLATYGSESQSQAPNARTQLNFVNSSVSPTQAMDRVVPRNRGMFYLEAGNRESSRTAAEQHVQSNPGQYVPDSFRLEASAQYRPLLSGRMPLGAEYATPSSLPRPIYSSQSRRNSYVSQTSTYSSQENDPTFIGHPDFNMGRGPVFPPGGVTSSQPSQQGNMPSYDPARGIGPSQDLPTVYHSSPYYTPGNTHYLSQQRSQQQTQFGNNVIHNTQPAADPTASQTRPVRQKRKKKLTAQQVAALKRSSVGKAKAKKHPCSSCEMRFERPSNLKTHNYTHTGEKPFVCQSCGRGFTTKSNMRRHARVVHPDAQDGPMRQPIGPVEEPAQPEWNLMGPDSPDTVIGELSVWIPSSNDVENMEANVLYSSSSPTENSQRFSETSEDRSGQTSHGLSDRYPTMRSQSSGIDSGCDGQNGSDSEKEPEDEGGRRLRGRRT